MGKDQLDLPPEVAAELDRHGQQFQAEILEFVVARHPDDVEAWSDLGHVSTRLGQNERALEADSEVVRRTPADPTARYNLACSLALLGRVDAAFAELERARALGYDDADHLEQDEDLAVLRADVRFAALVARLRGGAG